ATTASAGTPAAPRLSRTKAEGYFLLSDGLTDPPTRLNASSTIAVYARIRRVSINGESRWRRCKTPASTRGTGRKSVRGRRPRSYHSSCGQVVAVRRLQRPYAPVRFLAYSSWVINVADLTASRLNTRSTIADVAPKGMFPTTLIGPVGKTAERKSS